MSGVGTGGRALGLKKEWVTVGVVEVAERGWGGVGVLEGDVERAEVIDEVVV
jgi:phenylpyruvate tautomerase PptA (4-oxalocrotonate tautomerase family)